MRVPAGAMSLSCRSRGRGSAEGAQQFARLQVFCAQNVRLPPVMENHDPVAHSQKLGQIA